MAGVPNNTWDGGVWGEWEFQALAQYLGVQRAADAIGRWGQLEHWCLTNLTSVVPHRMVDLLLGTGGAAAVLELGLGIEVDGRIQLRDQTAAKVEQWRNSKGKKQKAGQVRHETATRNPDGTFSSVAHQEPSTPPARHPAPASAQTSKPPAEPSTASSSDQPSASASASPSASASTRREETPLSPPKGGRSKKRRGGRPAEQLEIADRVLGDFRRRSGVQYQVVEAHVALIMARLAEDGVTEHDLHCVVRFLWDPTGRDWGQVTLPDGKPARTYFTPETLFGPRNFHKYLEPARAWFREVVEPTLSQEERDAPDQVTAPLNVISLRSAL